MVAFGVTSAGAWGIFQSHDSESTVEKIEVRDEDNYAVAQKALSKETKKTWKAKLVDGSTPPDAGQILTVDTWTGIIDSAKLTEENGRHWKEYEITASRRDAAELTAYSAPTGS